jgi:hypothetical protein
VGKKLHHLAELAGLDCHEGFLWDFFLPARASHVVQARVDATTAIFLVEHIIHSFKK